MIQQRNICILCKRVARLNRYRPAYQPTSSSEGMRFASGPTALLGCVPRQELIDAGDLAVGDVGQDIGEPGLGLSLLHI